MINNYIKIAWRNMMKNKIFSFINIFGLTIGLTSFLLIALYVFDELTFDSFHENANSIYRVVHGKTSPEGKETKIAAAGYQVSEKARTDLPGVKEVVRFVSLGRINVSAVENTNIFHESLTICNAGFLKTFSFKLLQGDSNTALIAPHSVVVTEETARRFFNTSDVIGKALKIDADSIPFKITGVLQNFPANSHITFNLLFSESTMTDNSFKKFVSSDWNSDAFTTYVLLDGKTNRHNTEARINTLWAANQKDIKGKSSFILQPLKDIHFYSDDIEGGAEKAGSITYIYIFCGIALFVLFIACINYMNLTTARFTNRAKEIAVRKVAGASRKNLAGQFLSEAFLITFISLVLGLICTWLLLPGFNEFTQKKLLLGPGMDYRIWLGVGLTVIVVSLLSGAYPAVFQSGLKPLRLLKNKINIGKGNISLRRSLVVFQFALSIVMIIVTMVVYMQMKYINTKDMGFKKDQLVVVDINSMKVRNGAETIKNEFAKLRGVNDVSVSSRVPGEWKNLPKVKVKSGNAAASAGNDMYFLGVDEQFLKTYQIALVKGRNFLPGNADSSAVIINETAAKTLGITAPTEQMIEIPSADFGSDFSPLDKPFTARVIGIIKDFNFKSLHEPIAPMVLGAQSNPVQSIDYFTARIAPDNTGATLKQMDDVLHGIDNNHLFEYHFLDNQWDLFYQQDHIRETIFFIMAILSIVIACLGLFGLATYAAEQSVKEIGIRKVLGASVMGIVAMLSKDFIKLVLIAATIAFPVAWWAMSKWLNDFAYRITISWWVFALATMVAIVIALFTISFQSIKAALANPVKSLRSE